MRIVLADLSSRDGYVHKDTVVGGYGCRFRGFSFVTRIASLAKQTFTYVPSITMGYLAAIFERAGHEVRWTRHEVLDGDVAVVLSSLVDYRNETAWADAARARGTRVGFVGLAASMMPELFEPHADFLVHGEPEAAMMRLADGEVPSGRCRSEELRELETLPFPRWDLVGEPARAVSSFVFTRPVGGIPVLASRSCPEFCTYCPHRILAGYRRRSVESIADELAYLCRRYERPFVIFRDPLFTHDRDRVLALCDEIAGRRLELRFECETRLDRLDDDLLTRMRAVGLRSIQFGVESVSAETLKRVGRRPIPEAQQRAVIRACERLGVRTIGFFVLGFDTDTWESIAATIAYSISLGPTLAQFKVLTPYPGTPLFKRMAPRIFETDWQKFDGFTVTFHHPTLSPDELRFLLATAWARFYARPSWISGLLRPGERRAGRLVRPLDAAAERMHARRERAVAGRAVAC
jgi:radical SAM superfamily enzyme YgiQ (UPF0313 family)